MAFGLALALFCHPLCRHTHTHMCTADCIVVQQAPGSWGDKCVFLHVYVCVCGIIPEAVITHTVASAAQADGWQE